MIHGKSIERIFYNAGNGYTVASYHTEEELPKKVTRSHPENPGYFQAVGIELPTGADVEVELDGEWKETKYGMQLDVSGITETKLETLLDGYHKSRQLRELMVYLAPFGVTSNKLMRIQEHFGSNAYPIIKKNPFRLCEIKGFGFLTVDPIARKAKNFKVDNPERIKAAIAYVLQKAADEEGHLFLKSDEVVERAAELLNHVNEHQKVSERAIKDAGNEMIRKDQTLIGNGGGIYTRRNFQAEMGAAAQLMQLLLQKRKQRDIDSLLRQVTIEEGIKTQQRFCDFALCTHWTCQKTYV